MQFSILDLFTIGIGPSSSHTVGPMRAAARFAGEAAKFQPQRVRVELFGSLGLTGKGHGTHLAVVAGLAGQLPETVDPGSMGPAYQDAETSKTITLPGGHFASFDPHEDLIFNRKKALPFHPNGMAFTALADDGSVLLTKTLYSIGGGFIVDESEAGQPAPPPPIP
ncbi:MAG TPA: serine dehydratase beta chain, partial [Oceanipulchritudo sp.]|nr:serine dehydratase beta chain [Oceanipulchritudo sp.]